MWRSNSKRDIVAWTGLCCFLAFGCGVVLVKRFRPAGPIEFKELPASSMPAVAPPPITIPRPTRQLPVSAPPPATYRGTTSASEPEPQSNSRPEKLQGSDRKVKGEPEAQSISLNSGDITDLEKLPGVGPGIAQRIVDYRTEHGPFQAIDDLRNVKGIGEKRLAKILPFVRL